MPAKPIDEIHEAHPDIAALEPEVAKALGREGSDRVSEVQKMDQGSSLPATRSESTRPLNVARETPIPD